MPGAPFTMIASPTLVSEAEYLSTTYHPDCDFIDGEIQERNLGRKDHSKLQSAVFVWFQSRRAQFALEAFVELRIQVAQRRYRIPDICIVTLPEPDEQIFTDPPYLLVEVLSPEDSLRRLQERFDDYLAMGVINIWVLDPDFRRGWHVTAAGLLEARDRVLRTADSLVALPISDLFA